MVRRRLAPDARRALLLDAAEHELADRGFAAMRLADVAARTDVAKAVVYDHFPSKSALACAVLDRAMDDLLEHVEAAAAGDGPPAARLAAGVEAFLAFVETRPAARRLLFRDPGADAAVDERHTVQQRRADEAIAAILRPGLAPGHRHRAPAFAVQVKHALNGLAAWWWDHPEQPRAAVLEDALVLLGGGLLSVADAEA